MTKKPIEQQQSDEKIKQLEEKIVELENNWKRALADYQNLEKRLVHERTTYAKIAGRDYIVKLLPVFDTFGKTADHIKDEGIKFALKQLTDTLSELGIERIKTVGELFDPHLMEAIDVVASSDEGRVIEEIRPGYRMHDTLLRPAQVKVGKKKINEKVEEEAKKEEQ